MTRKTVIEALLENGGFKDDIVNIEHVYKGPPGNRQITPMSIVELVSRSSREVSLLKLNETSSLMKSGGDGKMEVQKAKTASQLKRNGSLARVCELLKKDPRAKDKTVEIVWQDKEEGTKNRFVELTGVPIFKQTPTDLVGTFLSPFLDLVI